VAGDLYRLSWPMHQDRPRPADTVPREGSCLIFAHDPETLLAASFLRTYYADDWRFS
jgi:hypothetical protein